MRYTAKMTMTIIAALILIITAAPLASAQNSYRQTLDALLKQHVKNGLVDYKAIKKDTRLSTVIEQMSKTNINSFASADEELAFWINAYNIWTIKIICDNYPVKSINDLHTGGLIIGQVLGATVWDKKLVRINNKDMTLNNIEHDIIRKKFNEPRIHFALVCAAISCPQLRSEAFTADRLDEQLNDQGFRFFAEKGKNRFSIKDKTAVISKILDWYESDFGKNEAEVLLYISRFLDKETAAEIKKNPKQWSVDYSSYDWTLNEQ